LKGLWIPLVLAVASIGQESLQTIELFPDTVETNDTHLVVVPTKPVESTGAAIPVRPESRNSLLYLGGGAGSAWYHLGVLEAVERYRIPVDTLVGSSWGAWIGALWSAGWSTAQIAEVLAEPEVERMLERENLNVVPHTSSGGFWDHFTLSANTNGVSGVQASWKVRPGMQGAPVFEPYLDHADSAWNSDAWLRFRMQETMWREKPGRSIPFRVVLCSEDARTSTLSVESRVLASAPLMGNAHSGEICAAYPQEKSGSPTVLRIAAIPMPIRSEQAEQDLWKAQAYRNQRALWDSSASLWVSVRPHRLDLAQTMDPQTLRRAGFEAFKSRLGDFASLAQRLRYYHHNSGPLPSKFSYQPVFDSVESVYQGHLASFWSQDTGLVAPQHFFTSLDNDGFYDSLGLVLGNGSDLLVRAKGAPQVTLGAGGFGTPFLGLNGVAMAALRWVDQFEYGLRVEGVYGQSVRGLRPSLRLGRLWQNRGDFFIEGDLINLSPMSSVLNLEPDLSRYLSEERRNLQLGVDYHLADRRNLRVATELGSATLETGMREWLNYSEYSQNALKPIEATSLNLYSDFVDSSDGYEQWFATQGHRLHLVAGFRSVGIHVSGQTAAPLYLATQGEWEVMHPLKPNLSLGITAAGGLDMRRGPGGRVLYPSVIEIVPDQVPDPALDNRYRLRMGISPWYQQWWTSENTSHHFALLRGTFAWHRQGSGLFLMGGYVRDFESNPWSEFGADRLFLEPVARLRYRSLDLRAGLGRQVALENKNDLGSFKEYCYYIQLGTFNY